jgi:hypothetical protein
MRKFLKGRNEAAPSLMQALPKRNIATAPPARSDQVQTIGCARRLLDRDRQASDQPRHFIELSGIMILDRARKTGETFVVAHRWHIAWDDRRYRAIELNDRHQITSRIEPAKQASCRNKTF